MASTCRISVVLKRALSIPEQQTLQQTLTQYTPCNELTISTTDDTTELDGCMDQQQQLALGCLVWASALVPMADIELHAAEESFSLQEAFHLHETKHATVHLIQENELIDALAHSNDSISVVDCRSAAEFHGLAPNKPFAGHLKDAVNLPVDAILRHDNDAEKRQCVRSFEDLVDAVEAAGIQQHVDRKLVILGSEPSAAAIVAAAIVAVADRPPPLYVACVQLSDALLSSLPEDQRASIYKTNELQYAPEGAFDLSSDAAAGTTHPDILKEYKECLVHVEKQQKANAKTSNLVPESLASAWLSPDGNRFFDMPAPLPKADFLRASREIFVVVSFVLAPLGFPSDLCDKYSLAELKSQCGSLFQDAIEVCSDVIYAKRALSEAAMAMSVHKWVEEERDRDCSEQVRAINEVMDELYEPPTFVHVPAIDNEQVLSICEQLKQSLTTSLQKRAPWAFEEQSDQPQEHQAWPCMYSSVVYALGFLPPVRSNGQKKLSSLQVKSFIKAAAESIWDVMKDHDMSLIQLQALQDAMDEDLRSQAQALQAAATESLYVMNHQLTRSIGHEEEDDQVAVDLDALRTAVETGSRAFQSRRYDDALRAYSKGFACVPMFHPEAEQLVSGSAQCHVQLGQLSRAKAEAELALRLNEFSSAAYTCLGQIANVANRPEEAMQHFVTAFILDGSRSPEAAERIDRVSRLVGRKAARPIFESMVSRHELPTSWLVESYFDSFEYDVDQSVRLPLTIESLLNEPADALDAEQLLFRAVYWKRAKRYVDAQQDLIRALDAAESLSKSLRATALNLHASFLYVAGDVHAAIKVIDESLATDADSTNAWIKRAGFLSELGDMDEAVECFEHAMALDSNESDTFLHKGQMELLDGDYQQAVQSLRRAISRSDALPVTHVSYGMALYKSGSIYQARDVFQDATRAFPASSEVHLFYGEVLSDMGNYADAMRHFFQAFELSPQCPLPFLNAGRVYIATNDPMRAIAHFEQALAIDPRCSSAHLDIAQVLFAQGRTTEAFAHFDRAATCCRFLPEVEEVCSCRAMAAMQLQVTEILGVELRHIMRSK